jgi:predicted phage terminase large subunit-like protein
MESLSLANLDPARAQEALFALEQLAAHEAREEFWAYRQFMNPNFTFGWWQRDVAHELQSFSERFLEGKRPKLVLEAPPQHGKSMQVIDFIAWMIGSLPWLKVIYASFSDRLGVRANLRLQRALDSQRYQKIFPSTKLNSANVVTVSSQYQRNRNMLEFVGQEGSFRNTTILGAVTGEGLDLGVVDDPIKGRENANSPAIRDKTWDWFTDDFFTRFSEDAALLIILTRWHLDDPVGRLFDHFGPDQVRVLRYPALAEKDEQHRKKGEPLFPELKSRAFLLERMQLMTKSSWESLYQQNPIVVGGDLFPIERFVIKPHQPLAKDIVKSVRYWDKAGTIDGGAYTAGVLMHQLKDKRFVVGDVVRGQFGAREREIRIKQTAQVDTQRVEIWVEQEPGSGGKESAERTIANLAGFKVRADKVTGAKETRAEPYAAQVQGGNVELVASNWIRPFLDEHEMFPNGKYKDQVDAAGGAFAKLAGSRYTLENVF